MKRLLPLVLALPALAHAWDFEVGAGVAHFADRGNMFWYQEGLPHQLQLTTPALELGVTGDVVPHLAWHADVVYMGRVRTDAVATPDDANYDPVAKSCRGQCIARSNFTGRGDSIGARLTLEPYTYVAGWRIGIEAGAYITRNRWTETVYDWRPNPDDGAGLRTVRVTDDSGWRVVPTAGASIGRGNVDLVYRWYRTRSPNGTLYPAIWQNTQSLTARYRF
jgi:hypothetical protein